LELFYTDNLFDLYIMQIEGGGHLIYNDKAKSETQYVSFAGTNGKPWRFISKHMLEKNYISDSRVETQREFLENNKDKHREVYSSCPSYVYFKKTDHEPLGSDMVTLTPNRSLATDDEHYKFKGLLVYVQSQRPIEKQSKKMKCQSIVFKSFSRFYLDQDTGGAIIGKSRADLYFGEGEYAEVAAHSMVQRGQIYFLMLKRE
jgi:membrane-bound lytic murein transglycosylase A